MIYFLANSLIGREGGSRAGADILKGMLSPDWDVTVVCRDRCHLPQQMDGEAIQTPRWIVPPVPRSGPPAIGSSPKALAKRTLHGGRDALRRWTLERALRESPPTLTVHNGFPVPGSVNSQILEASRNRLVIVHSSPEQVEFFRMSNPDLTLDWVSSRLRRAHALAFVTPQIRDSWSEVANLGRIRSFVVPNTTREEVAYEVMQADRTALRRALGLPEDAFIVSCVGKVDPAKGQDVLIEAIPEMLKIRPDLFVVFVGAITQFGEGYPERARAQGVDQHVAFVGVRDDPYSFIRASDMLIHPSRAEGQGLILLEAMLLKTPVLATDVGGIPFAVQHGRTGWLVPSEDPSAIVAGFDALVQNADLREQMVREAEARYWQVFSTRRHRERIQAMIKACI